MRFYGRKFERQLLDAAWLVQAAQVPAQVLRRDRVVVAQEAADPQIGGELPFGGAHAFALQVLGCGDAGVGAYPDARVAELTRGEDWNGDQAVVAARAAQQVA